VHFDWTIGVGNIIAFLACLLSVLALWRRIETLLAKFMIEHELLVRDYCQRKGIALEDIPTRLKGLAL
jgi:hypothetical protein